LKDKNKKIREIAFKNKSKIQITVIIKKNIIILFIKYIIVELFIYF
jgi:hypothetical protein